MNLALSLLTSNDIHSPLQAVLTGQTSILSVGFQLITNIFDFRNIKIFTLPDSFAQHSKLYSYWAQSDVPHLFANLIIHVC